MLDSSKITCFNVILFKNLNFIRKNIICFEFNLYFKIYTFYIK